MNRLTYPAHHFRFALVLTWFLNAVNEIAVNELNVETYKLWRGDPGTPPIGSEALQLHNPKRGLADRE